jgi:hypothetical protein
MKLRDGKVPILGRGLLVKSISFAQDVIQRLLLNPGEVIMPRSTKKFNLPPDTPMRRPDAKELARGQTVYYATKTSKPGEPFKVVKYRAARLRKVEPPIVLLVWYDTTNQKAETIYIADLVVPTDNRFALDDQVVFDSAPMDAVEAIVAKQPDKPGQIRSVAPLMGIAASKQDTGLHNRALVAVVDAPALPPPKPTDPFEEWIRMGTDLVHPDIENELIDNKKRQEQLDAKLKEIDSQHLAHIHDLEEELIKAKAAYKQDRSLAESRINHLRESQARLEQRQRVLAELKKLM